MQFPSSQVAYTVCSVSHLGQAKAMIASFLRYHPTYQVVIGLVDGPFTDKTPLPQTQICRIDEVGLSNLPELVEKYTVFELCGLARVVIGEYILQQQPLLDTLLYIDTDILFFGSLEATLAAMPPHDILITPHMFTPYPDDLYPQEIGLNNAGIYNSGFYILRRSENTAKFLAWWRNRLTTYGYVNFMDGMFVDQIWLNFVPLFFDKVLISNDLGLNCGYWNLHERHIETNGHGFTVNKEFPLVFFHFSGYNPNLPDRISSHTNRYDLVSRPELQPLFEQYRAALEVAQHANYLSIPNSLVAPKKYLRLGSVRELGLRIARKILRMWHG